MMMAHDSTPGPGGLDVETIDAVQLALRSYLDAPSQDASLRVALHRMASDARSKAILPERALVVLKELWYAMPSLNVVRDSEERVRLLQRVVTMCIKAYYAD
jgi:hypothetical protein